MAAGRSSRRSIVIVVVVAILMAGAGFLAAKLVVSPEDAAARAAPPPAGPITVPVAKKALKADIVTRGDIGFTGSAQVTLTDAGTDGSAVVTGKIPEVGSVVENGTVLLEVTGRPVLALAGDLPTYRSLIPGSTGPDVEQLEATLAGLGYDPGAQDKTYDAATGAAVAKLYATLGYEAPQPSADIKAGVASAQAAADSAAQGAAEAQKALNEAAAGPSQSQRLEQQANVDRAQAEYDAAQRTPTPPDQGAIERATQALQSANTRLAAAQEALAAATPANVAALTEQVNLANQQVAAAQTALDTANQGGPPDQATVNDKKSALDIAKAQRDEALRVDTTAQKAALTAAQQSAAAAQADLAAAKAAATTPLPASEVVWLAGLPRRVDEVLVTRGTAINGPVMSVSGADLSVQASVSAEEASLLKVGMPAQLTVPGSPNVAAVVTTIGDAGAPPADPGQEGGGGTTVVLQPQNVSNEQAQALRGANVKVTIPVASTAGAVLVVPVAALFSDANGTPRVEVLTADGSTRFQPVALGLSTGGEVELRPIDDNAANLPPSASTLAEGSLVVVGR